HPIAAVEGLAHDVEQALLAGGVNRRVVARHEGDADAQWQLQPSAGVLPQRLAWREVVEQVAAIVAPRAAEADAATESEKSEGGDENASHACAVRQARCRHGHPVFSMS